jgi:hypothetical protein
MSVEHPLACVIEVTINTVNATLYVLSFIFCFSLDLTLLIGVGGSQ